ncbi:hypothetical protein SDC9_165762 [bioreactor metagenome]|uniref:Uncharacterized protein n=1 Tax=bioreactor metagenome TaxID=1076179 RepID=A0A645FXG8_9ZZZZ
MAALALTVDDLLVGQHGLVVRAPVDVGVLAVGQATLEELQEEPLSPVVVLGVAGVQLPRPVQAQPVTLERRLLRLDVLVGPLGRMSVVLDRRVLGGQAERVPADRMQHLVALHAPQPRQHIAHRVRLGVSHVKITGGVGEHVEHIPSRLVSVVVGNECLVLFPESLPLLLRRGRVIADLIGRLASLAHRSRLLVRWSQPVIVSPDMKKPRSPRASGSPRLDCHQSRRGMGRSCAGCTRTV